MKIAIDGPAGAGKSTVARKVANQLDYLYIDTGAMYRALTVKALENDIDLTSEAELVSLLTTYPIILETTGSGEKVMIGDQDVSPLIRSPRVSRHVAQVASHPKVREVLVETQRRLASRGRVVMDGRDIGTHVLPDAELKIFLTASIEERARRRYNELSEKDQTSLQLIMEEIRNRDQQDRERKSAPLKKADDAIVIDSTGLNVDQVVDRIIALVDKKMSRENCIHGDL